MSERSKVSKIRADNPNFSNVVTEWLNEIDSDISSIEDSTEDREYVIESEHDTDSQESGDGCIEECDENKQAKAFYGKNKFKWSAEEPKRNVRVLAHNIVKLPGLRGPQQKESEVDPITAWSHIFSDDMVTDIVKWTNVKIRGAREKYKKEDRTELRDCDTTEMRALLGLLIYTAVFKSNHENVSTIFSTDGTGREIFRMSMSAQRFHVLLVCLRFDDIEEREERKKYDPTCAVSALLEQFNRNSQASFCIGAYTTIDEMLVSFRGRCIFKMYMPSKPAKYGLKVQCLTDARNHYVYNTYLYCGKGSDGRGLSAEEKKLAIPTQAALRLCQPILQTNRNVTGDNWYSSIELVETFLEKGLTFVGTLKKNKPQIPKQFLPSREREVGSSVYGFTNKMTLLSHVPKKGKAVLLISSMHHSKENDSSSNTPEIISFYNNTKGGVDTVDQMCANYSSSRRTRRWTMAVFCRILDMSAVNGFILHQSYRKRKVMERADFMKGLAKQLIEPYLKLRVVNTRLPRSLRQAIGRILGTALPEESQTEERLSRESRKRCQSCPASKRKKTTYLCASCRSPVCLQCTKKVCPSCAEDSGDE